MGGCCSYQKPKKVKTKYYHEFVKELPSMKGKTVAITGTTSGTGFVAAKTIAELGGKVYLLNRTSDRADAALADLKEAVPKGSFTAVPCDLQDFESVAAAADQLKDQCKNGLDVLLLNAGVMATKDIPTKDGYCNQMQTNHLSHFLLTMLLMPLLEKGADRNGEARVVSHSSIARKGAPLEEKYLRKTTVDGLGGNGKGAALNGPRWQRYHQTKLANCVFTHALHERLQAKESKVKALVAHPGVSATNLQVTTHADGGMGTGVTTGIMAKSQSAEDGAMGILLCACGKDVASGEFYGPGGGGMAFAGKAQKIALEDYCTDAAACEMLWAASLDAVAPFYKEGDSSSDDGDDDDDDDDSS